MKREPIVIYARYTGVASKQSVARTVDLRNAMLIAIREGN